MPELVSVIIPTFNRAGSLLKAVWSVLDQDWRPLELLVVDDGSTDQTQRLLRPLADQGLLRILGQPNRGVAAARNRGLRAAQGTLLAFLDSDDQWLPGKAAAQAAYFKAHPEIRIVQTQERWMRHGVRVNPRQKHRKRAGDIFLDSLKLCLISPSAVMLRRSLLDEVGLFDESLAAAEDYDLWLRVTRLHPVGLIDREYLIRRAGHADQLSARHSIDRYRIRALEKVALEPLSPERRAAVMEELERRRRILDRPGRRAGQPLLFPFGQPAA